MHEVRESGDDLAKQHITVGFIVVGTNPRGDEYSLMVVNHDAAAGLVPLAAVQATLDDVGATIQRMLGIDLLRAA